MQSRLASFAEGRGKGSRSRARPYSIGCRPLFILSGLPLGGRQADRALRAGSILVINCKEKGVESDQESVCLLAAYALGSRCQSSNACGCRNSVPHLQILLSPGFSVGTRKGQVGLPVKKKNIKKKVCMYFHTPSQIGLSPRPRDFGSSTEANSV